MNGSLFLFPWFPVLFALHVGKSKMIHVEEKMGHKIEWEQREIEWKQFHTQKKIKVSYSYISQIPVGKYDNLIKIYMTS